MSSVAAAAAAAIGLASPGAAKAEAPQAPASDFRNLTPDELGTVNDQVATDTKKPSVGSSTSGKGFSFTPNANGGTVAFHNQDNSTSFQFSAENSSIFGAIFGVQVLQDLSDSSVLMIS